MSSVIQMLQNGKEQKGSDTIMIYTRKKWLGLNQLLEER